MSSRSKGVCFFNPWSRDPALFASLQRRTHKDTSEPPITNPSAPQGTLTDSTSTPTTSTSTATTSPTNTAQSFPPGISTWTYTQSIDGVDVTRSVYLHVPPELSDDDPTPVLFSFHGNGGRATPFLASLESYVLDGRFIGVYAQGHDNAWNTGQADLTADDASFIQAILDDLAAYPSADLDRLYAQGFSNGAGMSTSWPFAARLSRHRPTGDRCM